jgi:hypothetical protein
MTKVVVVGTAVEMIIVVAIADLISAEGVVMIMTVVLQMIDHKGKFIYQITLESHALGLERFV